MYIRSTAPGNYRSRLYAALAMIALLLLQLASATHDVHELAGDSADNCTFCVQLDQPGGAIGAPAGNLLISQPKRLVQLAPAPVALPGRFEPHQTRAPPLS